MGRLRDGAYYPSHFFVREDETPVEEVDENLDNLFIYLANRLDESSGWDVRMIETHPGYRWLSVLCSAPNNWSTYRNALPWVRRFPRSDPQSD